MTMAQMAVAEGEIDLKAITSGMYSAENLNSMTPLEGGVFVQISKSGKKLLKFSFQTGKETGVLFDTGNTKGEKISEFDDYEMSKDGRWILVLYYASCALAIIATALLILNGGSLWEAAALLMVFLLLLMEVKE